MQAESELVVEAVAVRALWVVVTSIAMGEVVWWGVGLMVMVVDGFRMVVGVVVGRGAHVGNW